MRNTTNSYKLIHTNLPALLFIIMIYTAVVPAGVLGTSVPVSSAYQDEFARIFREGRDLIDSEEWVKAADKFTQITDKYPNNKSTDSALYWKAFCYKKQGKLAEAQVAVDRLIKDFPLSSWISDAKVLLLEASIVRLPPTRDVGKALTDRDKKLANREAVLANRDRILAEAGILSDELKRTYEETSRAFDETSKTYNLMSKSYDESSKSFNESGASFSADMPIDQDPIAPEDEVTLAAFQSLLSADPNRAIELAGDVLRSESKASEMLKRLIVRSFRHSRFVKVQTDGSGVQYVRATTNVGKEFTPQLRDMLQKGLQKESNASVRTELIYALANIDDSQSLDFLIQTYSSTKDTQVKKTILFSLGSPALSMSGTIRGTKINAVPSPESSDYKLNFERLMDLFISEKDPELRRAAFVTVQRFILQSTNDGAIQKISRLYDAEPDERFRISIINFYRQIQSVSPTGPKENLATAKLMDIAQNDPSSDLRFLAIYALRQNKDPEVVNFLKIQVK